MTRPNENQTEVEKDEYSLFVRANYILFLIGSCINGLLQGLLRNQSYNQFVFVLVCHVVGFGMTYLIWLVVRKREWYRDYELKLNRRWQDVLGISMFVGSLVFMLWAVYLFVLR